jgi:hypothetical protein
MKSFIHFSFCSNRRWESPLCCPTKHLIPAFLSPLFYCVRFIPPVLLPCTRWEYKTMQLCRTKQIRFHSSVMLAFLQPFALWKAISLLCVCVWYWGTQDLTLARQALYHLSHCTNPFLWWVFSR